MSSKEREPEAPEIWRDENGVPHVEARSRAGLFWGMGYCHAKDRGLQMLMMRILGRGQASEFLESSDDMLRIDTFFRRMNWMAETESQLMTLPASIRELCDAYCEGANTRFQKSVPWELRLLGYKPVPWQVEDSILVSRMIGYIALAQSQAEMERLLIEMVQAGVDRGRLDCLFPGILGGLDEALIQQVTLRERIVPTNLLWNMPSPTMMASNNWVVSGKATSSGRPILANDPHLEVNRLPNVWYEISLKLGGRYMMGSTLPGLPGVLVGRNSDLAWGATYAFMDSIDSWVERCKDGTYWRNENWLPFRARKEIIRRKGKPSVEVIFHENDHGVLDGDPHADGYYLTTQWSVARSGARSIGQILSMWDAKDVREGMDTLGQVETAWNWVLVDRHGNIGYQMSGLMPKRREGISGFVPLAGWKAENDWQGFVPHEDLPRAYNPEHGYFVTANQDLNAWGNVSPINMPMAAYRADRIANLLTGSANLAVSDHFKIQHDVFSLQAEAFMRILKPLLPDTQQGRILRHWDFRYNPESQGAYLFEQFYGAMFQAVFGRNGFGETVTVYLAQETGTFADFYGNFDRVLLADDSPWFNGEDRESLYRRVAAAALSAPARAWGEVQQIALTHILFGKKLPRFLGFDRGPITIVGGRATPHQGQIYRSGNRNTTFAPSFRMVTDLARDESYTAIAGGPSDRRFSKWYCSELENWKGGKYKTLSPSAHGKKRHTIQT